MTAARLKDILLRKRMKICVAESLTGGYLQTAITSVSGSSDFFEGGVTAYNIDQKVNLLGVDRRHAEEVNCVSERVAREMASGAREKFSTVVALATTGYAEPSADNDVEHPFAYFAIDIGGHVTTGRIDGPGLDRVAMQQHVADLVLRRLVEILEP